MTTRRTFLGAMAAAAGVACAQASGSARLRIKPGQAKKPAPAGLHKLELRADRDALLYIPEAAAKFERAPLVVSLHGATRKADRGIELFRPMADELGFLLLAPASEDTTWDAIIGEWGPDPAFINRCLAQTFRMRSVDAGRIAMAGFSD